MSSFMNMEDNEMSNDVGKLDQFTDIESYRKLIQQLFSRRNYLSAIFWAEKVAVLTNNNPKDVYQLAQCMFMLREYNRAAHVIKSSGLEKSNLLCLTLLVECLYDSKEYDEALKLLTSIEIEDLNTSLHNESEQDLATSQSSELNKNVSRYLSLLDLFLNLYSQDILSSLYLLKAKILEAMDKRTLAIDCYIIALQKSVYITEALDALMQHEMLMAWEEKDLINSIMPTKQNGNEADLKILRHLYESKLKKYYITQVNRSRNY